MRPTRRSRVTRGRTVASACRASSMRGLMVAMPWLTLPAIEPDASNTIIASSEQGEGVASAARAGPARARGATKAVAAANFRTCAQDAEDMADLIRISAWSSSGIIADRSAVLCGISHIFSGSQSELAQAGMIRRAGSGAIPFEQAVSFADRQIVDRGEAAAHQSVPVELPVLVAVGAKPVS